MTLDIDSTFEHGVLLDVGSVEVGDALLGKADLAYQPPGCSRLTLANRGADPARLILLGGPPFPEQLVMWWNFVARTHEEIVAYRQMWQAHDDRFGEVSGYRGTVARLPAPVLPGIRLKPRGQQKH